MSEATKKIFISHRSLDSKIVNELVQYMENVGIEKDEIFYTSADSTGARFELGPEVKKAINEAEIYIAILSNNYFNSVYCCNELGFLWANNKNVIVFGLPGIDSPKDYCGFVADWMNRRLNNPRHIDFLYEQIKGYSIKQLPVLKLNEYKDAYIDKANKAIEEWSLNQAKKQSIKYSPEKIFEIDTLVANGYYSDKELMFFKYLIDTNNYIWGFTNNIEQHVKKWEKKNRLKPFLSEELENFLVMLVRKNYLSCKIEKTKDALAQTYVGKTDDLSKYMMAVLNANENGEKKYNYFEMDERLFRAIVRANGETIKLLQKELNKYRLKWYQKYPKGKK